MPNLTKLTGAVLALTALAGCATVPEPCTPEWVDYQVQDVTRPFVIEYRNEIRTLRDLAGDLENPDLLTAFRLAGQVDTIILMVENFRDEAVPDIRAVVAQCDQPRVASRLLADMLTREGVDPDVVRWVEALGIVLDDA
ncbi:MAG: hypothetical protein AAF638_09765 [Pseudomonadota bacterium]